MATGSLDANGIWQYGEDDSNTTFSALLNRLASSVTTQIGARKILQVVASSYATTQGTSSTSFVTTNLSTTITPRSTTSKILIFCSSNIQNIGGGQRGSATIFRGGMGGTNLGDTNYGFTTSYQANGETVFPMAITYLDSPATTSATTYTLAYKTTNFTYIHASNSRSSLVLVEVAA